MAQFMPFIGLTSSMGGVESRICISLEETFRIETVRIEISIYKNSWQSIIIFTHTFCLLESEFKKICNIQH